MRTVSFKVPASLDDAIRELARSRRTTRSALFREALENLTRSERLSFTAAADALVQLREGPEDLSSNPAYLEG
jgi:predicted transcriptional regulator